MGQKVHPKAIRLGIIRNADSCWYAHAQQYATYLNEDMKIREFLFKKLHNAGVSRIYIERLAKSVKIKIHSSRPGIIIGKKGSDIEALKKVLSQKMSVPVHVVIEEVRKLDLDARLVAENIARQLERRVMFRRAMKKAAQNTMRAGAEGVKVCVAGRLGGAEIARTEWSREGRVPLHTFRADIDYGVARAATTYGIIGIKVWIFKGEVMQSQVPLN